MLRTSFIIITLVLSIVLPVWPVNAEATVDYTALHPLPSYRLESLAM